MTKLIPLICLVILSTTACSMKKEGGKWVVKRTIVDEVNDTVDGAKELAADVQDASGDVSNQEETESSQEKN